MKIRITANLWVLTSILLLTAISNANSQSLYVLQSDCMERLSYTSTQGDALLPFDDYRIWLNQENCILFRAYHASARKETSLSSLPSGTLTCSQPCFSSSTWRTDINEGRKTLYIVRKKGSSYSAIPVDAVYFMVTGKGTLALDGPDINFAYLNNRQYVSGEELRQDTTKGGLVFLLSKSVVHDQNVLRIRCFDTDYASYTDYTYNSGIGLVRVSRSGQDLVLNETSGKVAAANPPKKPAINAAKMQKKMATASNAAKTSSPAIVHKPANSSPANTKAAPYSHYTTHTVKTGESLSTLASQFRITVDELREANHLTSDRLYVSQVIKIPDPSSTPAALSIPVKYDTRIHSYRVQKGDNLYRIAAIYGSTVEKLTEANQLKDNILKENQLIVIP